MGLQRTGRDLLLSYQMEGGGRQCYKVIENKMLPVLCNSSHLVATTAMIGTGTQVMIELTDRVPVIRRFPAEFSLEKFRFMRAGWRGNTVLCSDGADAKDDAPGEGFCAEKQHESSDAVLSPLAEFKVVMERTKNGGATFLVWKMPKKEGVEPVRVRNEKGFVAGNAFAIDGHGRLAYFRGGAEGKTKLELVVAEALEKTNAKPTPAVIDAEPTCMSFSPDGAYLLVGTGSGHGYWYAVKAGEMSAVEVKHVDIGSVISACAISNDGGAAFGSRDGRVLYFDRNFKKTTLTERVVYRLSTEVKEVRIDDVDSTPRRVTALGAWQPNNCLYPALPGQSLRVWELVGKDTDRIPVANTCFPNQPILALGGWGRRPPERSVAAVSSGAGLVCEGAISERDGIRLLMPQGVRWHPCPACRTKDDSGGASRQRWLLKLAVDRCADSLPPKELESRYGLQMGWR